MQQLQALQKGEPTNKQEAFVESNTEISDNMVKPLFCFNLKNW